MNNIGVKKRGTVRYYVFIVISVIEIIFGSWVTLGGIIVISSMPNYQICEGTVIHIYDDEKACATCKVDGESHQIDFNYYTSDLKIGDKVTISYDPNRPWESEEGDVKFDIIMILIFFIVMLCGGIFGVIFYPITLSKVKRQNALLKENYNYPAYNPYINNQYLQNNYQQPNYQQNYNQQNNYRQPNYQQNYYQQNIQTPLPPRKKVSLEKHKK